MMQTAVRSAILAIARLLVINRFFLKLVSNERFVVFGHSGTLPPMAERQSAQMSKIEMTA